jgi:hypothetical protein
MENQLVEEGQGYKEKQIDADEGSIIGGAKGKRRKDIDKWIGFVDLLGGALVISGAVGFVSKYFIAQTHVIAPYILPTFFLGLQLFFIHPGLDTKKLHPSQHWYGVVFWSAFVLSIVSSLFEWSWLIYECSVASAFASMKLNSIADVVSVVLLLTQAVFKSWAKGLSFRSLGGKFEWCGIIVLWLSAPALQVVNAVYRFGGHISQSVGTVLLGFVCLGVVLVLVGEHEPQDEDMELERLKSDQLAATSAMYKSNDTTQCTEAEAA